MDAQSKILRERAERQIALAEANGARAKASPDYRTVFITYRDGVEERIRIDATAHEKPH
ncbi:MAG TPA: hypothetical protein PLS69_05125 [Terricaulis sp.]|nr:hypothetical protein [Terricaulis sp.]HRP11616.1 hypothetical protein [Terricaulis sp.]